MNLESRRSFNGQLLGSLLTFGLVETLFARDLFAADAKPMIGRWILSLVELCQSVKDHKVKDTDWQTKIEELYKTCDLPELVKLIDLDKLARDVKFPDQGAASLGVDLSKVEGMPKQYVFGKQIFAMKKGRAVVPHGHDNMCTAFIVLRGNFVGKHYDRVEDKKDHYLIKPTIDRTFKPGESSTISDHKDNVHWFTAENETGFLFNIHVVETNPENPKRPGRVYVDPMGEKLAGGLIKAPKLSYGKVNQLYG
jgi:hypothetical protein